MDLNKWSSIISRLCFVVAFALFVVGIVDWATSLFGSRIVTSYMPGRLIEFGVMFLIPVVTVLLREIREELRKPK